MITRVMSFTALPGKGTEAAAILKEVAALSARIHGGESATVALTVGGAIGEVSLIAKSDSVEASIARVAKNLANPEMAALVVKLASLVADGGSEKIYQHI